MGIYVGILFLAFTSCKNVNPHHGLYNALFYDYDERLKNIDENLTQLENKEKSLKEESQKLSTLITKREQKRDDFEVYLRKLYVGIEDINGTLNSITYDEKMVRIKEIVLKIKEEINSQELFKAYLLEQRVKINENIEYVLSEIKQEHRETTITFTKKMIDEGRLYLQYKK